MPHDPERVAETREWLTHSVRDLAAAQTLLRAADPLPEHALFHCQQAAEKALKAFLVWHDRPFRKTHDLEEVGGLCTTLDPSLAGIVDQAAGLSPFAWQMRYPSETPHASEDDCEESLTLARAVYDAIVVRLPVEVRP